MHGYELKKQLDRRLGHFWQVSLGSLYPTLDRLAQRGAVEILFDDDRTSRRKKVYRVTDDGEREFLELIDDRAVTQWEEEKFPLRLAFFHYLKPDARIRLLERRRAYLDDKLTDLRESLTDSRGRIDSYTLSLLQHALDATERDIDWLDEMIAAERPDAVASEPEPSERPRRETEPVATRPTRARATARTRT